MVLRLVLEKFIISWYLGYNHITLLWALGDCRTLIQQ